MKIIIILMLFYSISFANFSEWYFEQGHKVFMKTFYPKQFKEIEERKTKDKIENRLFQNKKINELFQDNKKINFLLFRAKLTIDIAYDKNGLNIILNSNEDNYLKLKNFKFKSNTKVKSSPPFKNLLWKFKGNNNHVDIMFNQGVMDSIRMQENIYIVNDLIDEVFDKYSKIYINKYEKDIEERKQTNKNRNSYIE